MDSNHTTRPEPNAAGTSGSSLFHLLAANEGVWGPYRSVFNALLQVQRDRAAALSVQRELAIELAELMKREQDMVMRLSASALDAGTRKAAARLMPSDAVFDAAIACVRELGLAAVNLHIGALEALRQQQQRAAAEARQHTARKGSKPATASATTPMVPAPESPAPESLPASVEPITGPAIAETVPEPSRLHDMSKDLGQHRRSFHGEEIDASRFPN